MCGRFTLTATLDELLTRYGVLDTPIQNHRANYNAAPTQQLTPVVINIGKNNILDQMRWGLIPSWAKDPKIAFNTINARAETVAENLHFVHPFVAKGV